MGSSQTRARTRVPCIGRQILNHCATREAQGDVLKHLILFLNNNFGYFVKNGSEETSMKKTEDLMEVRVVCILDYGGVN